MASDPERGPGPAFRQGRRWRLTLLIAWCFAVLSAPLSLADVAADAADKATLEVAIEAGGGSAARLKAHVDFLADPHLRGRLPGTPGYDLAAAYVADQFWSAGLTPAGPAGGWFQPVPLRVARGRAAADELVVIRDGQRQALAFPADFFRTPDLVSEQTRIVAPMAFVGYGVDAPGQGHRDYAGIDVTGKVVVMLAGYPESLAGAVGAHFGTRQQKLAAAARHGAVGVIIIFTPLNEGVTDWGSLARQVDAPAMGAVRQDGTVDGAVRGIRAVVAVHHRPAARLFDGSGQSLEAILEADREGRSVPVFDLAGEVELAQGSNHQAARSHNVVAMVPGTDPVLARDLVVYVAHLDHIGVRPGADGEPQVHAGALDNAMGVAVMLEVARRFAASPARRTMVFLAATAEEAGLVGSGWFTRHPAPPGHRPAAVINLDMPVLLYDFTEVVAWGAERSSLGDAVAVAAAEMGLTVADDPFPSMNVFTRSDHYPFVRQGVPAVLLAPGPGTPGGSHHARFQRFMREGYHTPLDHRDQGIDYGAAARFTRLTWRTGQIVAGQAARPTWREGDFFGETFSR